MMTFRTYLESTEIPEIPNDQIRQIHQQDWLGGKHKEIGNTEKDWWFPYPEKRNGNDAFVKVFVPVTDLDMVGDMNSTDPRIQRYRQAMDAGAQMGPSWVNYNGTMDTEVPQPLVVQDGNHRAVARLQRGEKEIEVYMPKTSYLKYMAYVQGGRQHRIHPKNPYQMILQPE